MKSAQEPESIPNPEYVVALEKERADLLDRLQKAEAALKEATWLLSCAVERDTID